MLEEIVKDVKIRVRQLARAKPIDRMHINRSPKRSLCKAIENASKVPLIAEIKRASPSAGDIRLDINVLEVAHAMVRGGAIGLSILTEPKHFRGDPGYLREVRRAVDVPILRKDFIVEEYQLYESADLGADVILLISELLGQTLPQFIDLARELGMEALVEVANEEQVKLAVSAGAELIGINNRDLRSMRVDIGRTKRLAPLVPEDVVLISESGIRTPSDVEAVLKAGADAVLIGTALMRSRDIEQKVRALVNVGRASD
jgi:indole-3-glycerol phosphate synthase